MPQHRYSVHLLVHLYYDVDRAVSWPTEALLLSAGLTTASRYHWVPWRWNLPRDYLYRVCRYCLLRYEPSLLVALTTFRNYSVYCLLDISSVLLPDNSKTLVDISRISRDTWPVTDQSNRLSNMSLFTLGSRQRSGGWHPRWDLARTLDRTSEHVAFNCAHVINYHRWAVISRDKRDSLIVARLLPPRSLESAQGCSRTQRCARARVRTCVRVYGCVYVYVCVRARLWDPGPTLARYDGELTSWRAAAPRRRAFGEPSTVRSERREIRHPFNPSSYSTLLSPPPTMSGTVLRFCPYHLVVERAPSYTLPREIAQHFWKYYSCYRKRTFRSCPSFCGKKHSSQIQETPWQKNVSFVDHMYGLPDVLIPM